MGHVIHTLPHQLRVLAGQVDEIQLTIDVHSSRGTTYGTSNYAEKLAALRNLLADVCARYPHAHVVEVDYSPETMRAVARAFIRGDFIPTKAWTGAPFHAYFYGLFKAKYDYVLHIDSDMLFGGRSQTWVQEALDLLQRYSTVLGCYPLGGPPRADGTVGRNMGTYADKWLWGQRSVRSEKAIFAFSYPDVSGRIFLIDRRRFLAGEAYVPLVRPRRHRMIKTLLFNSSPDLFEQDFGYVLTTLLDPRRILSEDSKIPFIPAAIQKRITAQLLRRSPYLTPEDCLSIFAFENGFEYIGFLGSAPGLWTLHPPYRTRRFYDELPRLIERIERGDVPEGQRGDFDLNDAMFDWSGARRLNTRWDRLRARR